VGKPKRVAYNNKYWYNNKYNVSEVTMDTLSYSSFRSNLASTLDKVNNDHTPVLITRQNGKPAVVISLEDFHAYEETAYLMASPKNAERLNQALAEVEAGNTVQHGLIKE
jgi:antitoxin YefM